MFKIVCFMEVFDDFVELPAHIADCMVFYSLNEAETEVELLKQQEPSNKYEIRELNEDEIDFIERQENSDKSANA